MNVKTRSIGLLLTGALALGGAAACGSSSSGGSTPKAAASPVADIAKLSGEHTQVTLNAGFAAALKSLKVTPGLIGTATLDAKTGTLTFPITGGNVKYYKPGTVSPYVQGSIDHQGSGFSLTAGGIKVGLSNFVVNPGTSMLTGKVTANGKVVAASAPLFFLNGRTLQPLATGPNNTAILNGTKVYLTSTAAALLDKTYNITALSSKTLVGVAKITVNT
ncbi:MAG TPA: hypothetical protein VHV79_00005 [Mycobacteriales bacterium]|nr:hypothetical protein [Mycobacteriales bacterium]